MKYFLLRLQCLLIFLVFALPAAAQLDNSVFYRDLQVDSADTYDLRFGLDALGFSKNNEYFNKIADGYTLFGTQLNPKVIYFPAAFARVEAGVFMQHDFGNPKLRQVRPTFTIKIDKGRHAFLFGTLEGDVSHRYIEPLYDFEKMLVNRLEQGMQYKYESEKLWLDAWIDWRKMIYPNDPFQEEVVGGVSSVFTVFEKNGLKMTVPVQFTGLHRGGQIDSTDLPLVTLFNAAAGFKLHKAFKGDVVTAVYTENHLVGYTDYSNTKLKPFEQGSGVYLNAGINTKYQNLLLSYWRGNGYISELGGDLYQSASTTVGNPGFTQKNRELLIIRLLHDIHFTDNLTLTLRLEPFIDFNDPALEFSNSIYIRYTPAFKIANVKAVPKL